MISQNNQNPERYILTGKTCMFCNFPLTELVINSSTLPAKFQNYSLEDLELLCICGHYVNCHDGGLGGGDSICEEDDCGCVSCEFDYEGTVAFHYFQEKGERWLITKLTTDCKKQYTMTNGGGLPMIKEMIQMEIKT